MVAKQDAPKRKTVKALRDVFVENAHRRAGDVFDVRVEDFSETSMEETNEKPIVRKHGAEQQQDRRVLEPAANANTPGDVGHGEGADTLKKESEGRTHAGKGAAEHKDDKGRK